MKYHPERHESSFTSISVAKNTLILAIDFTKLNSAADDTLHAANTRVNSQVRQDAENWLHRHVFYRTYQPEVFAHILLSYSALGQLPVTLDRLHILTH